MARALGAWDRRLHKCVVRIYCHTVTNMPTLRYYIYIYIYIYYVCLMRGYRLILWGAGALRE